MMLLKLALKNIIRYKRRSVLTLLLITFSISIFILMDGLVRGIRDRSYSNLIDFETAHIQIRTREYDEKKPFQKENFLENHEKIIERLSEFDFIRSVTARIRSGGEVDNGIDSAPVEAWGIDLATDKTVFNLHEFISEGELTGGGTLIGKQLAEDMGVAKGDYIYFTTRTPAGMLDSIELEITGIINSVDPNVNNSTLYITLSDAIDFLSVNGVTQIAIKTDSLKDVSRYRKKLAEVFPEYDVLDWKKLGETYIQFAETDWNYGKFFIYIILFLAFVGIANTMLMSVFEKKKEIGTLKALGMNDLQVQGMFILEGFWIGIAGCILGMIVGSLFVWYFTVNGLDYSAMMGEEQDFGGYKVMGMVYAKWSLSPYISSVFMSLIAAMGASLFAARHTTKMDPAECLRTKQ